VLISDGVIGLRPIEVSDAQAHLAGSDVESVRWRSHGTDSFDSVDEVADHFRGCAHQWMVDGPCKTFAVVDEQSDTLVGTLDIGTGFDFLAARQVDVSYGIYPKWRRQGMASRAVVLACRYIAWHDLGDEAVLRIDSENKASVAVAHRLGFAYHHTSSDEECGRLDWFIQAI